MPLENIDFTNSTEPEVVKAVINEIKTLGDNYKKNYESLRSNFEELKYTLEENSKDILTEEKITKLTEDISTRQIALDEKQAEMDKKTNERIDNIEVVLKRPIKGQSVDVETLAKDARDFQIACLAVGSKSEKGVDFETLRKLEVNIDEYQQYTKVFESWVRKYGGSREMIMTPEQYKALQVGVDPDGGLTVTPFMSNRITQRIFETDPMRQLASIESITTGALEWMAEWDEAGYAWEGETTGETTITSETSTPTWKKRRVTVHTLAARPKATQTLLEDSGINVENWLANKVSEKFSRAEAAAFVTGNGIGKPRGFTTYDNGTDYGQVEQVNMGAAAALTADGFVDVKYALKEYFLERATWLMNRTTVAAAMKLKTGSGDYIWKPGMLASDTSSSILNLPVRMATTMPVVAANALSVALGDWAEAYLIVDRLGITVQRDPYSSKPFVEFYTRKRVGGDVNNFDALKIGKISA